MDTIVSSIHFDKLNSLSHLQNIFWNLKKNFVVKYQLKS